MYTIHYSTLLCAKHTERNSRKRRRAKMEYTTIRLLNTDSTFVAGSITDTIGNYQFNTKTGQYIVVVSAIGYKTQTLPVTIASGITDAPIIKLLNESYVLDGVTITGSSFVRKKTIY